MMLLSSKSCMFIIKKSYNILYFLIYLHKQFVFHIILTIATLNDKINHYFCVLICQF